MKIAGQTTRSIWLEPDGWSVGIFDQRRLPWATERLTLREVDEAAPGCSAAAMESVARNFPV